MLLTTAAAAEELERGVDVIAEELLTVVTEETDDALFTVPGTEEPEVTEVAAVEELFPALAGPATSDETEVLLTELTTPVLELTSLLETLEATGSGVILLATDEVEPLEPAPPPPPHALNNNVLLNIRATLKRLQTLADNDIVARALERLNGRLFIANYLECRWWMT